MAGRRRCDEGFTLVELVVVVVVIGILAAIALPIFLAQQQRARVGMIKNDLGNAAVAAAAYATDHTGSFVGMTIGGGGAADLITGYDLRISAPDDTLTVRAAIATGFCIEGANAQVARQTYKIDTRPGGSSDVLLGTCS